MALASAMKAHQKNRKEIEYLFKYERGEQPILQREKKVRPEINNKVIVNHASEITSFCVGYVFGSPITYVQRQSDRECDDNINALNDMMFEEGKSGQDQQLARDFSICGVGYRMILAKPEVTGKSVFSLIELDSRNTFIVRSMDVYRAPKFGVCYCVDDNNEEHVTVYTDKYCFTLTGSDGTYTLVSTVSNALGVIPIIEYTNGSDRMGCFERVLSLLDALNVCESDRVNGVSQYTQSFIWGNNVEITSDDYDKLREQGMLLTNSTAEGTQGTIQYLSAELNQDSTQTLIDDLYERILRITGVPGKENNSGGDTGQAVLLRNGWQIAETSARSTEQMFIKSERELLKVALEILKNSNTQESWDDFGIYDIDVKFSRNRTDGLVAKVQALSQGIAAGIDPLDMIEIVGLFSDPQTVWENSKPYMKKWEYDDEEATNAISEVDSDTVIDNSTDTETV